MCSLLLRYHFSSYSGLHLNPICSQNVQLPNSSLSPPSEPDYCWSAPVVQTQGSNCPNKCNRLLVWIVLGKGMFQKIILWHAQTHALTAYHYTHLVWYILNHSMYVSMLCEEHKPHMTKHKYTTVKYCCS